ncbi:MAG: hypothetical protein JGK26_04025 [Microcoleus sp. PH2017_27_LUM_O_A]|uniref:hypothetical protein n=1 Tax=unclassified Microcoleus TaxID=2642155 RepID=UPI001D6A7EFA|nr:MULTISPECIES: hypothetical protein [unclassified Microcoleus]MCC3458902.1 hypothetical protein [Microcoleus sp. PH2017_11_PCY_U_A]MCC3558298.1 hypothetical protein [Microcoleus sp. PH2017_27_LUM_O_A]
MASFAIDRAIYFYADRCWSYLTDIIKVLRRNWKIRRSQIRTQECAIASWQIQDTAIRFVVRTLVLSHLDGD